LFGVIQFGCATGVFAQNVVHILEDLLIALLRKGAGFGTYRFGNLAE
jgi:hypothetical protein